MRYSVQPKDGIFVKGYEFLSFAKNMVRNTGKNISKNLSGKCSKTLLDHAKKSAKDAFRTASKRAIQNASGVIGTSFGNKIANKITKF